MRSTRAKLMVNRPSHEPQGRGPLSIALLTTAVVAALVYLVPLDYAATAVGFAFLGVVYLKVLRRDDGEAVRKCGLSLGGLFEPSAVSLPRLARESGVALAWATATVCVVFPLFWLGFIEWWQPSQPFSWVAGGPWMDDALGQLLVIALPEEAFYRGYLQSSLDERWRPRWNVLGAPLGWGWIVTSAVFAVGHLLTDGHPSRLAVFFPALLFGWLRAKSGGIGSAVLVHAGSNLFASLLLRGYGLGG